MAIRITSREVNQEHKMRIAIMRIVGLLAIAAITGTAVFGRPMSTRLACDETGLICGTVAEADGGSVAGLTVSTDKGHHTARTAEDGWFTISGVEPGLYVVSVSRGGKVLQNSASVTVRAQDIAHIALEVPTTPLLLKHLRLLLLLAASVLVITASVYIKYAISGGVQLYPAPSPPDERLSRSENAPTGAASDGG